MSRFKFRAWDDIRRRMMTSPKFVEFRFNSKGKLDAVNYNPKGGLQNLELMQFTGLKDKNGVDIYDGDIVNDQFDCNQLHIILWDEGRACFSRKSVKYDAMMKRHFQSPISICEVTTTKGVVIGNIYENKDLL